MPSGLRKTSGNHFEIYYEQPWGGIASDKSYVDIEPNQLVNQQGVVVSSGKLEYFALVADPLNFFGLINPRLPDSFPYAIWVQNGAYIGCDQYGYIYQYGTTFVGGNFVHGLIAFNTPTIPGPPIPVMASDGPWSTGSGGNIPSAVQVINGIAYIANYSRTSTYTYDGLYAFNFISDYTGGQIMGVLDDYLIQFNTNSLVDGIQPNRVNWSGPGKFSTWDPAIDRTAGFNTLASVNDQITGFFSYANVGVAITQKGLVELSPTGIAIGPFNFTTLWTSELGQGSIYQRSIVQYGQSGYLATDSGIYKVSTGAGFQDITGTAKQAIFNSIQPSNKEDSSLSTVEPLVAASILLYWQNNTYPTPYFMFCVSPSQTLSSGGNILICWLMNIETGTWQRAQYSIDDLVNAQYGLALAGGVIEFLDTKTFDWVVPRPPGTLINANNPTTIINIRVKYGTSTFYALQLTPNVFNRVSGSRAAFTPGILNLVFRGEEIKIYRQPTIRRAVIRAYGSGSLNCFVNGQSFGTVVLDGTTTSKTYLTPSGNYTGEAPQFSITSTNFKGVIEKVMLAGTYADGDID